MRVIGITGGTGAGKSTVIDTWKRFGPVILNCDEIYHALLGTEKRLLWEIEDTFPGVVSHGVLDRRKLGEIVFASPVRLEKLNAIAHRYVLAKVEEELAAARQADVQVTVIEALYLLETDLAGICDVIVGVIAQVRKRVKRIIDRDRLDEEYAWARLRAQETDEYFLQHCDVVIENNGTLDMLREKAMEVYLRYR